MSFKVAQATVPPSSLEEVEQLVLRLYAPGGAQHIQQVERQLRDLQHSPEGWKIADFLLHRSTSQVRYFGALTFQINLNTKGATLDDEGLASLGTRVVQGIITELNRGEGPLVLRKLCSTFAVYCVLDRPDHAKFCVKQLVLSLLQGTPVSDADTQSSTYLLSTLASNLNNDQILACLIFLSSLKEESSAKIAGYTAQTTARIIDRMDSNLHDAIAIFSECFSIAGQQRLGQEGTSTRIQAFATYSDWVFFAQKAWQGSEESLGPLRELLGSALTWLPTLSVEDASETIQVFTDLLSSFGMFFRSDHLGTLLQIITSPWGMNQMNAALQDPEDTSSFVALVLAFADVTIEDLVTKPDSPLTTQTMSIIHSLTTCNGIAAVEDKRVVDSLEFWHAYVENVVDSEFEDEGPKPWLGHAQSHIAKACQELWVKIQWPPAELYHSLDQDQQKEFRQFRADVSDLLGSAYPVLRSELSKAIVHGCLDALNRQSWHEVEAFLYSMNAISISEKTTEHQILIELFGSDLYAHLQNPNLMVPAHTRRTAVDLLGQYAKFFERQQVYLPPALEFLFASLPNTALAQRSAKSIAALCSSCRSSLTDKLVPFIESYQKFLVLPTATQYTKERVLGGVAAIIQAVSDQDKQAEQLSLLLGFVQDDIRVAMNKLSALQFEEAQVEVATAMSCLVGIAKGLEEPTDSPNTNGKRADFWTVGPGSPVQEEICQTIRMAMHIFEKSPMPLELHGDVIESICAVFKSGFSEAVPGPFVLLPRVTVEFFATVSAQTPRLEVILNMLCAYLRSHSTPTSPLINMEVGQLLQRLIIVIKEIQDPRNEAEISSGLIEVLTRFMPKYTDVLLETPGQEDLSYILNFTMECLIVPEYLPKRKAAEFWAVLIALPKTTSTHLDEVITYFGPTLAHNLINQVSGNATRTDLDWFTEPLRSFIKRDVQTKKWIELALTSADFPAPNVTMEARRKFLKALSVGNSLVLTKRVVLGYWNECKGLAGTGYAP